MTWWEIVLLIIIVLIVLAVLGWGISVNKEGFSRVQTTTHYNQPTGGGSSYYMQ